LLPPFFTSIINNRNSLFGEMTSILKIMIANGLPIAGGKSEIWIYPLIIGY
jgi:hypothetical protein